MDAADQDLPEAAVQHVSQMLTLAKSKHQEAIALLGTPDLLPLRPRGGGVPGLVDLIEDCGDLAGTKAAFDDGRAFAPDRNQGADALGHTAGPLDLFHREGDRLALFGILRRYSRDYVRAEDQARAARRGVWSGQFEMPWEWRAARRSAATG